MTAVRVLIICVLCLSGVIQPAHGVRLNSQGMGEVLLFPYYTAQGSPSQLTTFTVINDTSSVKALRVRFREGRNSRSVLELNLYLAPNDSWAAAVIQVDENLPVRLISRDSSCTVPALTLVENGIDTVSVVEFSTENFKGALADGGGLQSSRTYEGFFEVIEMGEVAVDSDATSGNEPLGNFALQTADGVPVDCDRLVEAWSPGGVWDLDSQTDMSEPGGGLIGQASVIDVVGGTRFSYAAETISDFYNPGEGLPRSLNSHPNVSKPDLNSAATGSAGEPVTASVIGDDGNIFELSFDRPVDAVSAVLMRQSMSNDFGVESILNGKTEWVVTFPTRQFYVSATSALPPFRSPITPESELGASDARAAELAQFAGTDRNAADLFDLNCTPSQTIITPPPPPDPESTARRCINEGFPPQQFPYASNVMTFDPLEPEVPSILLRSNNVTMAMVFDLFRFADTESGSIKLSFSGFGQRLISPRSLVAIDGLPALGFAVNAVSVGLVTDPTGLVGLSSYANATPHRTTISILSLIQQQEGAEQ